jgi:hypothetical protein
MNIRAFPAFLQYRREVQTATVTSGSRNGGGYGGWGGVGWGLATGLAYGGYYGGPYAYDYGYDNAYAGECYIRRYWVIYRYGHRVLRRGQVCY